MFNTQLDKRFGFCTVWTVSAIRNAVVILKQNEGIWITNMLCYSCEHTGQPIVFTDQAFDIFNCLFIVYGQVT